MLFLPCRLDSEGDSRNAGGMAPFPIRAGDPVQSFLGDSGRVEACSEDFILPVICRGEGLRRSVGAQCNDARCAREISLYDQATHQFLNRDGIQLLLCFSSAEHSKMTWVGLRSDLGLSGDTPGKRE